ncbi:MAG: hypothetical protein N2258_00795 [Brevinematales bacterium]|nr:hypothetical protein [Brevinematales bacterium]
MVFDFLTLEKHFLSSNAFHSEELIDNSYKGIFYFKIITLKDIYQKINLITVVNDMPFVISGYKFFDDERFDYFIVRCDEPLLYNGILYYFEMEDQNGNFKYLGKNGVTEEEWKVEDFEYQPKKVESEDVFFEKTGDVFGFSDSEKGFDFFKQIGVSDFILNKKVTFEDLNCYNAKEIFSKFSVSDENFNESIRDFFINRKITSREFIKIIGVNIFSSSILSSYFQFFKLDLPFNVNIADAKLAIAFQLNFIGMPLLSENIKSFPNELIIFYKDMISIRNSNNILKKGDIRFIFSDTDVFGFERFINNDRLLIFFNRSEESYVIDVTKYFGNGDFIDISKEHPLKRKRQFSIYSKDFVILKKTRER